MSVRIIHVGLGGWGGNWARTAIPEVSEVQVVAVVDPSAPTLEAVRTHGERNPGHGVLVGQGWDETSWPEGRPPTGDELE